MKKIDDPFEKHSSVLSVSMKEADKDKLMSWAHKQNMGAATMCRIWLLDRLKMERAKWRKQ